MRVRSDSKLRTAQRAAAILLINACGGADHAPSTAIKDASAEPSDAAMRDGASSSPDAGDGTPRDAGDASARDEDAGTASGPFDPVQDCQVVAEHSELSIPVEFSDESGFALSPGLTGFGVAFQQNSCGALGVLPVAALGGYPKPAVLFDSCETVAQGVSLLHGSGGYRLGWVDNAQGSAELQTLQLPDSLDPPAEVSRHRITDNALRELAPVQASLANTDVFSWIALDGATRTRAIMLQSADGDAQARALVSADAGYGPTQLALARLGTDAGALAFVSEQGKTGAFLLPLDSSGAPLGEPIQLSGAPTANGSVDIATREEDGGAVIYSVDVGERHEVRFRRLDKQGAFFSDEIKVATFPLNGRDASIARLGGGYVVAFRSMTDPAATRGEIRLVFVTKEGNLQRDSGGRVLSYVIAEASTTGGRVTARVSRDGQLLVGFVDIAESASSPQLRLIRKRLDCAL